MPMKFIRYYLLLLLPLLLVACDSADEPQPVPTTPRTVLVYMVANNNLGSAGFDRADLEEMQQAVNAGQLNGGRLLVYHCSATSDPVLKEVTPEGTVDLKTYDSSTASVTSERMLEVFDDMYALAPADDYGLILWSHADGWLQEGLDDDLDLNDTEIELNPKAFGYDRGRKMKITTLGRTLEKAHFSFVYFDCCYMGAVEVAYELRRATDIIVASPSEVPSNGMPYDQNVKCFFEAVPDLTTAARNTFEYYDALTGQNRTCTMSVINTAGLEALADATRQIMASAPTFMPEGFEPQKYMLENRCYHFDLAQYVDALEVDDTLKSKWYNALATIIMYEAATPMLWDVIPVDHHCGLSTYIINKPSATTIKGYDTTSWYQAVYQ